MSEEDQILAAYQASWDAWLAASDPPNPDHPDLARYNTATALADAVETLQERRRLGFVVRLPEAARYRHMAQVVEYSDVEAVVQDCSVDDALLLNGADGRVMDGTITTRLGRATLLKVDGTWKVATLTVTSEWEGEAGCATAR